MALLFPYASLRMHSPAIALAGRPTRPKPLIPISVLGPINTRLSWALLDTGADDTVFPERLAPHLGIDLTNAPEAEASGVGGIAVARLRYVQVTLCLAAGNELSEWPAMVAFTAAPLHFPLLGFAGVLQFFSATFHGDREEVELAVNSLYPGS